MFGWLLLHVVIGAFYRPIRQGRKVAYLTLVSFLFLVIALVGMFVTTKHGGGGGERRKGRISNLRFQISNFNFPSAHPEDSPECPFFLPTAPCSPLPALNLRPGPRRPLMNVQVVGCSHHGTSIVLRERLAFGREQAEEALQQWRLSFRDVEGVLLSTCNRVEIYAASQSAAIPGMEEIGGFLARFHRLDAGEIMPHLFVNSDEAAVRHLFSVAASLDSMVLGEPQILAQVKQAYQAATEREVTGPLLHMAFQAAIRVARRVTTETAIHQRRVSIPSVAVADFARQIFERFDDKETLVIGAGEMAEETLRYLRDEGARRITVVNRSFERACERAREWQGQARPWEELPSALAAADLIISTRARGKPIVTIDDFRPIHAARGQRPLFVLDLAVPRDFDPLIGDCANVYLYSVDDLQAACQNNRLLRNKECPRPCKSSSKRPPLHGRAYIIGRPAR